MHLFLQSHTFHLVCSILQSVFFLIVTLLSMYYINNNVGISSQFGIMVMTVLIFEPEMIIFG